MVYDRCKNAADVTLLRQAVKELKGEQTAAGSDGQLDGAPWLTLVWPNGARRRRGGGVWVSSAHPEWRCESASDDRASADARDEATGPEPASPIWAIKASLIWVTKGLLYELAETVLDRVAGDPQCADDCRLLAGSNGWREKFDGAARLLERMGDSWEGGRWLSLFNVIRDLIHGSEIDLKALLTVLSEQDILPPAIREAARGAHEVITAGELALPMLERQADTGTLLDALAALSDQAAFRQNWPGAHRHLAQLQVLVPAIRRAGEAYVGYQDGTLGLWELIAGAQDLLNNPWLAGLLPEGWMEWLCSGASALELCQAILSNPDQYVADLLVSQDNEDGGALLLRQALHALAPEGNLANRSVALLQALSKSTVVEQLSKELELSQEQQTLLADVSGWLAFIVDIDARLTAGKAGAALLRDDTLLRKAPPSLRATLERTREALQLLGGVVSLFTLYRSGTLTCDLALSGLEEMLRLPALAAYLPQSVPLVEGIGLLRSLVGLVRSQSWQEIKLCATKILMLDWLPAPYQGFFEQLLKLNGATQPNDWLQLMQKGCALFNGEDLSAATLAQLDDVLRTLEEIAACSTLSGWPAVEALLAGKVLQTWLPETAVDVVRLAARLAKFAGGLTHNDGSDDSLTGLLGDPQLAGLLCRFMPVEWAGATSVLRLIGDMPVAKPADQLLWLLRQHDRLEQIPWLQAYLPSAGDLELPIQLWDSLHTGGGHWHIVGKLLAQWLMDKPQLAAAVTSRLLTSLGQPGAAFAVSLLESLLRAGAVEQVRHADSWRSWASALVLELKEHTEWQSFVLGHLGVSSLANTVLLGRPVAQMVEGQGQDGDGAQKAMPAFGVSEVVDALFGATDWLTSSTDIERFLQTASSKAILSDLMPAYIALTVSDIYFSNANNPRALVAALDKFAATLRPLTAKVAPSCALALDMLPALPAWLALSRDSLPDDTWLDLLYRLMSSEAAQPLRQRYRAYLDAQVDAAWPLMVSSLGAAAGAACGMAAEAGRNVVASVTGDAALNALTRSGLTVLGALGGYKLAGNRGGVAGALVGMLAGSQSGAQAGVIENAGMRVRKAVTLPASAYAEPPRAAVEAYQADQAWFIRSHNMIGNNVDPDGVCYGYSMLMLEGLARNGIDGMRSNIGLQWRVDHDIVSAFEREATPTEGIPPQAMSWLEKYQAQNLMRMVKAMQSMQDSDVSDVTFCRDPFRHDSAGQRQPRPPGAAADHWTKDRSDQFLRSLEDGVTQHLFAAPGDVRLLLGPQTDSRNVDYGPTIGAILQALPSQPVKQSIWERPLLEALKQAMPYGTADNRADLVRVAEALAKNGATQPLAVKIAELTQAITASTPSALPNGHAVALARSGRYFVYSDPNSITAVFPDDPQGRAGLLAQLTTEFSLEGETFKAMIKDMPGFFGLSQTAIREFDYVEVGRRMLQFDPPPWREAWNGVIVREFLNNGGVGPHSSAARAVNAARQELQQQGRHELQLEAVYACGRGTRAAAPCIELVFKNPAGESFIHRSNEDALIGVAGPRDARVLARELLQDSSSSVARTALSEGYQPVAVTPGVDRQYLLTLEHPVSGDTTMLTSDDARWLPLVEPLRTELQERTRNNLPLQAAYREIFSLQADDTVLGRAVLADEGFELRYIDGRGKARSKLLDSVAMARKLERVQAGTLHGGNLLTLVEWLATGVPRTVSWGTLFQSADLAEGALHALKEVSHHIGTLPAPKGLANLLRITLYRGSSMMLAGVRGGQRLLGPLAVTLGVVDIVRLSVALHHSKNQAERNVLIAELSLAVTGMTLTGAGIIAGAVGATTAAAVLLPLTLVVTAIALPVVQGLRMAAINTSMLRDSTSDAAKFLQLVRQPVTREVLPNGDVVVTMLLPGDWSVVERHLYYEPARCTVQGRKAGPPSQGTGVRRAVPSGHTLSCTAFGASSTGVLPTNISPVKLGERNTYIIPPPCREMTVTAAYTRSRGRFYNTAEEADYLAQLSPEARALLPTRLEGGLTMSDFQQTAKHGAGQVEQISDPNIVILRRSLESPEAQRQASSATWHQGRGPVHLVVVPNSVMTLSAEQQSSPTISFSQPDEIYGRVVVQSPKEASFQVSGTKLLVSGTWQVSAPKEELLQGVRSAFETFSWPSLSLPWQFLNPMPANFYFNTYFNILIKQFGDELASGSHGAIAQALRAEIEAKAYGICGRYQSYKLEEDQRDRGPDVLQAPMLNSMRDAMQRVKSTIVAKLQPVSMSWPVTIQGGGGSYQNFELKFLVGPRQHSYTWDRSARTWRQGEVRVLEAPLPDAPPLPAELAPENYDGINIVGESVYRRRRDGVYFALRGSLLVEYSAAEAERKIATAPRLTDLQALENWLSTPRQFPLPYFTRTQWDGPELALPPWGLMARQDPVRAETRGTFFLRSMLGTVTNFRGPALPEQGADPVFLSESECRRFQALVRAEIEDLNLYRNSNMKLRYFGDKAATSVPQAGALFVGNGIAKLDYTEDGAAQVVELTMESMFTSPRAMVSELLRNQMRAADGVMVRYEKALAVSDSFFFAKTNTFVGPLSYSGASVRYVGADPRDGAHYFTPVATSSSTSLVVLKLDGNQLVPVLALPRAQLGRFGLQQPRACPGYIEGRRGVRIYPLAVSRASGLTLEYNRLLMRTVAGRWLVKHRDANMWRGLPSDVVADTLSVVTSNREGDVLLQAEGERFLRTGNDGDLLYALSERAVNPMLDKALRGAAGTILLRIDGVYQPFTFNAKVEDGAETVTVTAEADGARVVLPVQGLCTLASSQFPLTVAVPAGRKSPAIWTLAPNKESRLILEAPTEVTACKLAGDAAELSLAGGATLRITWADGARLAFGDHLFDNAAGLQQRLFVLADDMLQLYNKVKTPGPLPTPFVFLDGATLWLDVMTKTAWKVPRERRFDQRDVQLMPRMNWHGPAAEVLFWYATRMARGERVAIDDLGWLKLVERQLVPAFELELGTALLKDNEHNGEPGERLCIRFDGIDEGVAALFALHAARRIGAIRRSYRDGSSALLRPAADGKPEVDEEEAEQSESASTTDASLAEFGPMDRAALSTDKRHVFFAGRHWQISDDFVANATGDGQVYLICPVVAGAKHRLVMPSNLRLNFAHAAVLPENPNKVRVPFVNSNMRVILALEGAVGSVMASASTLTISHHDHLITFNSVAQLIETLRAHPVVASRSVRHAGTDGGLRKIVQPEERVALIESIAQDGQRNLQAHSLDTAPLSRRVRSVDEQPLEEQPMPLLDLPEPESGSHINVYLTRQDYDEYVTEQQHLQIVRQEADRDVHVEFRLWPDELIGESVVLDEADHLYANLDGTEREYSFDAEPDGSASTGATMAQDTSGPGYLKWSIIGGGGVLLGVGLLMLWLKRRSKARASARRREGSARENLSLAPVVTPDRLPLLQEQVSSPQRVEGVWQEIQRYFPTNGDHHEYRMALQELYESKHDGDVLAKSAAFDRLNALADEQHGNQFRMRLLEVEAPYSLTLEVGPVRLFHIGIEQMAGEEEQSRFIADLMLLEAERVRRRSNFTMRAESYLDEMGFEGSPEVIDDRRYSSTRFLQFEDVVQEAAEPRFRAVWRDIGGGEKDALEFSARSPSAGELRGHVLKALLERKNPGYQNLRALIDSEMTSLKMLGRALQPLGDDYCTAVLSGKLRQHDRKRVEECFLQYPTLHQIWKDVEMQHETHRGPNRAVQTGGTRRSAFLAAPLAPVASPEGSISRPLLLEYVDEQTELVSSKPKLPRYRDLLTKRDN